MDSRPPASYRKQLPDSKIIIISQSDPAIGQRQAQEVDAYRLRRQE